MDFINSLTAQQYFLIGGLIASIPGTIGIVEFVKRHHYRVKAEKLWTGFVLVNVTVCGFILTAADAVAANIGQVTHIGSLVPQIAPFVAVWGPRVSIAAILTHTVAMALYKWWVDRKAGKPISNINLSDLSPQVQAVTSNSTVSGQPSSSFGTAAAGVDVIAPPSNIFSD